MCPVEPRLHNPETRGMRIAVRWTEASRAIDHECDRRRAPFQGGRLKYGLQEIAGINQTALLSIKPFVFPLLVGARERALGVGAERAESYL